jgi:hypothetical protein
MDIMNYIETHYLDVLDLINFFINIHGIYKYDYTNLVKIYKSSPFNYCHIIKSMSIFQIKILGWLTYLLQAS